MIPPLKRTLLSTCLCTALVVLAGTARAQDALDACVAQADPAQRLACFDAAMAARRGTANVAPAPAIPVATEVTAPLTSAPQPAAQQPTVATSPAIAPAAPAKAKADFGLELRRREQNEDMERSLRVSAARHNDFTGWTIEFDDGSTWKQIGTDRYDIEVGKSYTIRRGSLNSFQLGNADNNRKIRVRREE
jgi:hypothetical protein